MEKKLNEWLDENDIKVPEFATQIGVTSKTVYRYISGERIPEKEVMPKISKATEHQVTANSFY